MTNIIQAVLYINNSYKINYADLDEYERVIEKIIDLWNSPKYVHIGYIGEFLDFHVERDEITKILESEKILEGKEIYFQPHNKH